jgi:hypothetical protein
MNPSVLVGGWGGQEAAGSIQNEHGLFLQILFQKVRSDIKISNNGLFGEPTSSISFLLHNFVLFLHI